MEKLEQLVSVINSMKENKENENVITEKERFYILALLKEIGGEDLNLGALRESYKIVARMVFDPNTSIAAGEVNDAGKKVKGIILTSDGKTIGNIVAHIGSNDNKVYRVDVRYKKEKPNGITTMSFGPNSAFEYKDNYKKMNMEFDENGIEIKREQIIYSDIENTIVDSHIKIERDPSNITLINGIISDKNGKREFSGKIYKELYSLNQVNNNSIIGVDEDDKSITEEFLDEDLTYITFPELKEAVKFKLSNNTHRL